MIELLDAYDENHQMIGTFSREEVHSKGLWHNTIHCWLYDESGNIYFQVRSDSGKLYTTASGHVQAGESLPMAFGREVKEEIGIDVNYQNAQLLDVVIWKMDKEKNGKLICDRAFANVYLLDIGEEKYHFHFDDGEVAGIVKINAQDTLALFQGHQEEINGVLISDHEEQKIINREDFLLMPKETLLGKYGKILEAVIKKIKK